MPRIVTLSSFTGVLSETTNEEKRETFCKEEMLFAKYSKHVETRKYFFLTCNIMLFTNFQFKKNFTNMERIA